MRDLHAHVHVLKLLHPSTVTVPSQRQSAAQCRAATMAQQHSFYAPPQLSARLVVPDHIPVAAQVGLISMSSLILQLKASPPSLLPSSSYGSPCCLMKSSCSMGHESMCAAARSLCAVAQQLCAGCRW